MPRFGRRRRGDATTQQRNIAQVAVGTSGGLTMLRGAWDTQRAVGVQTRESLVAAITNAVASDVGDVDSFPVTARQLGTDRDVTDASPFAYALNVAAGAGLTASLLRQHISLALDYAGECYLVEVAGTVTPLIGGNVEVLTAAPGQHNRDGSPALIAGYLVRSGAGRELGRYDQDGMAVSGYAEGRLIRIHSPYPGDPIKAQSYIEQALSPAELLHLSRQTTRALMRNAGWPSGILRINDELISDEELEAVDRRINSRLNDPNQRGRQFVVRGDTEYEAFATPDGDGGIVELSEQARRDVMAVWNLPDARLGWAGGMTYENQRTSLGAYYRSTVLRRLNLVLSALNQITRAAGYVLEVDTSAVPELNEDAAAAAERAASLFQSGLVTLDEARDIVGLPPVVGGETFATPPAAAVIGASAEVDAVRDAVPFERAAPPQPDADAYNATYDALTTAAEEDLAAYAQRYHARLYRNIVGRFERLARVETRGVDDPAPFVDPETLIDVDARNAELANDLPDLLEPHAVAVATAAGDFIGVAASDLPRWQGVLARRVSRMVEGSGDVGGWTQTLANDVSEAVRAGYAGGESVPQIASRIAGSLGVDPENPKAVGQRALTIARTETNGLANDTTATLYEESGVVRSKRWYSIANARTRATHLAANGQTVPLAGRFTVGGVAMDRPHDPAAPAREVVNCRCRLIPIVDEKFLTPPE